MLTISPLLQSISIIAITTLACVSNLTTYNENEFEIFLYLFISICVDKICHNFYYLQWFY